jgi:hypothetical protein
MPYCLKCGTKVEDAMTFCPNCGASLKDTVPERISPQATSSNPNPQPRVETTPPKPPEAAPLIKQVKADYGFIKYLDAGLILVTLGVSMIFELTNPRLATNGFYIIILLVIGLIIILSAVYYLLAGRRHLISKPHEAVDDKKPAVANA